MIQYFKATQFESRLSVTLDLNRCDPFKFITYRLHIITLGHKIGLWQLLTASCNEQLSKSMNSNNWQLSWIIFRCALMKPQHLALQLVIGWVVDWIEMLPCARPYICLAAATAGLGGISTKRRGRGYFWTVSSN